MTKSLKDNVGWALKNYELALVALVLLILLGSSTLLVIRLRAGSREIARDTGVQPHETMAQRVEVAAYQQVLDQLLEPYRLQDRTSRMFLSEDRVWCVHCNYPIPYDATVCPFCEGEQPDEEPTVERGVDTDRDGIPDWIEILYGMDPGDPADAQLDLDGDGFRSLSEYRAGTEPDNPRSHPPFITKLRVVSVEPARFQLLFMGVTELREEMRFQINFMGRTRFARMGETIVDDQDRHPPVTLVEYDPAADRGPTLFVNVRERQVGLVRGESVQEADLQGRFILLTDRTAFTEKGMGDEIDLHGRRYEIVRLDRDAVEMRSVDNAYEVEIPRLTEAEIWRLRGRPEPEEDRRDAFPSRDVREQPPRDVREQPVRDDLRRPPRDIRPQPEGD